MLHDRSTPRRLYHFLRAYPATSYCPVLDPPSIPSVAGSLPATSHLTDMVHFQTCVLRLPAIKRMSADPSLPDHLRHRNTYFSLLQHPNNLLNRKTLLLHLPTLRLQRLSSGRRLTFLLVQENRGRSSIAYGETSPSPVVKRGRVMSRPSIVSVPDARIFFAALKLEVPPK